jgi:hypothetical protein
VIAADDDVIEQPRQVNSGTARHPGLVSFGWEDCQE